MRIVATVSSNPLTTPPPVTVFLSKGVWEGRVRHTVDSISLPAEGGFPHRESSNNNTNNNNKQKVSNWRFSGLGWGGEIVGAISEVFDCSRFSGVVGFVGSLLNPFGLNMKTTRRKRHLAIADRSQRGGALLTLSVPTNNERKYVFVQQIKHTKKNLMFQFASPIPKCI